MELCSLPSNWKWMPISTISSDTERKNPSLEPEADFLYVDIASVNNQTGKIQITDVQHLVGRNAPSRARKSILANDVIFATTRPYLRNIALVPHELNSQICSTGFCVIRANSDSALPEYLYYACRSNFFIDQLIPKQKGANYPAVNDSDVYETLLPLPYPDDPTRSLAEQRRIVERIEALFAELRECRQLHGEIVKDTGRLMDAVLQQIFDQPNQDWIEEPLNTVAHIQSGTAKGRQFGTRKTIETPYLRVANVQAGYLDLSEIKTITIAESELEQYRLHQGDLLLTEGGDYDKLGRGAIWEGQIDNCIHQNHIFAVRFEPSKIIPKFAEFEMQSWHARNYFMSVAKKTTNLATINKTKLGDFPMRYPSPTEQQRIVSFLDAIKVEISEMRQTEQTDSGLLTQMEQAVLAQAFRGEL